MSIHFRLRWKERTVSAAIYQCAGGIKKYIFPGVMVLSLWEMISCGSADGFYILDIENLRLHQILFTKGINNDLPMTRWY